MPSVSALRKNFEKAWMRLLEAGASAQDVQGDGAAMVFRAANDYAVALIRLEVDADAHCCRHFRKLPCKCGFCNRHGLSLLDAAAHYGLYHDQETKP